MSEPTPSDRTEDFTTSGDHLDAGLAAAFGPDSGPPLPAGGSVLRALSAELTSVPHVLLRDPSSGSGAPVLRPSSDAMPARQDPAARLQLHGEIARGGMGAVLKGRDVDLGRDVAVKVLLETHHGKTELVQRFVEEAQISGQLQHLGVAPVYELGQLSDRRPYFTMKLVKGKTLAALLAARKAPDEERDRFVGIFGQVCHTLAYAHARGVIHRDLKPSNVMVGAFAEVQVMDWGLAKVLPQGGVADEGSGREGRRATEVSVIRTRRGSDASGAGSQTEAGTVLGTPAYMAPEQAGGDVDRIDERADVFGLGAILCEILTGQPPYAGKKAEALSAARAARLEGAFARLGACGADAELVALARRCLAAEVGQRPRDAGQVAAEVTAYQQSVTERLRAAEVAGAEARARAEEEAKTRAEAEARLGAERRARRLTAALAAAVLLAVTVAGASGLWHQRQRAERQAEAAALAAELRQEVAAALDKVTDLQKQARWAEARVVLEQAKGRLDRGGPEELQGAVQRAGADLDLVDRLDAARLNAATVVGGKLDWASAVEEYAAAFAAWGLGRQDEEPAAVGQRVRASAVWPQAVAALDDWALRAGKEAPVRRGWLLAVARAADPGPWRDRFSDPAVWEDRPALERLAGEAQVDKLSPQLLAALGAALRASGADALPLLTAAQRQYPSDFWLNFELGDALRRANRPEEAIGYYRAALALRPATPAVYLNMGVALVNMGRREEAIAAFRKASALDRRYSSPHTNLGLALRALGRREEAFAEFQTAVTLDPNNAHAHNALGTALAARGRTDEAIGELRKAIALDLKVGHVNLGNLLIAQGRRDEAIAEFRKAIALNPKNAEAHSNLGLALAGEGRLDEAITEHRKAIALNPRVGHANLGHALRAQGRLDEALAEWRKALEIDPKNAAARNGLTRFEPVAALQGKLPALLAGDYRPRDNAERLRLALLCGLKKYNRQAAQLYGVAFAAEPKQADNLSAGHRYNAACCAARASAGRGEDATALDGRERSRLRRQALDWLRADLALRSGQADSGRPAARQAVRNALRHWQRDVDLAGLRDKDALARLPAEERQACEKLWADVAEVLKKVEQAK